MQQPSVPASDYVAALPDPETADNVAYNPSLEQLREFSRHHETTTEFGSPSYVSRERSRNAERTKNTVDHEFDATDYELVDGALSELDDRELVCLDRQMGRHHDHTYVCRYYVPKAHSRIALGWAKLFEPVEGEREPDFHTVQLPDREEIGVRVFPDEGFTAVVGSDYTGEAKKSFLRLFMYYAKRQGGLGLHAGSKRVELETDDGLETVGQLFLGLSGTGKSTLTAHGLWLDEPEGATMLQDDVCALGPDGTVAGSEGQGLFVKTHGLDSETEPAMYDAVTDESAVLENVDVDGDGAVDFDSDRYTTNGRAIIQRERLSSAGADIDLPEVDQIFFITRNPAMPPIAKLTPEEAAVAFMLGESVQTSAGDPSAAGESIRVVGTNPFIIGSEGEEGNRFRELITDLDVDCFVLNTGSVGPLDVGVEETVTLLRTVARESLDWERDGTTGLTVPSDVPGMDIDEFDVATALSDPQSTLDALRDERDSYLARFDDLDPAIRDARY
ncbi:phosphoenolpyruvate carboxykinase (ATP) [Haloarcula laminariae]|uniref:phosphoenolpyruvate carboxykinase (ATP) n=1 Tax=Haloarcula laminariae TaxID=2961577 RepID=UPI0024059958|nr:phosphoenolpyruvate carboxykinase (ATP) [Halomicroarcula sp. FL173]